MDCTNTYQAKSRRMTHGVVPVVMWRATMTDDKRATCRCNAVIQWLHGASHLNDTHQLLITRSVLTKTTRLRWRHEETTWRQRQLGMRWWLSRQPLHVRVTVNWHSPDTVPVGDVQLTVTVAGYNVTGIFHSLDVNTFTEWTECVGGVHENDGRLFTDDVDYVV